MTTNTGKVFGQLYRELAVSFVKRTTRYWMGYRSIGAFALKKKYVTKFWRQCVGLAEGAEVSEDVEGNLLMTYEGWKMYDSYNEVKEFLKFMDELDEAEAEDDDEVYIYLRIGENHEDIEWRGSWQDNPFGVDLVQKIDFEHGPKTSTKTDSIRDMKESVDG